MVVVPIIDLEEAQLCRGLVLHELAAQYPLRLTERGLTQRVLPFYTADTKRLKRDLRMLEDQGYLTKTEETTGAGAAVAYQITPTGIYLVEGSTTDPGVRFQRE